MAHRQTWTVLALGSLLVATAVLGTALGMMDGEAGALGARLLLAALSD
jgi:hypothetical protein